MPCPEGKGYKKNLTSMKRLTIQACPLCGGTHFRHYMDCTDCYASGEVFAVYECKDCGFRFTQNTPTGEEMELYYGGSSYISHSDTRKGIVNRLYHCVRRYMLGRKARLVRRALHRKTGRLLDIGTGTGYFIHAMYEKGWDVEAVEKNKQARRFAWEHFGLEVEPENRLRSFAPGSFDVITLWHSMEHIESLNKLWETLHRLLSDDGVLIVAVPNSNSYDAVRYGPYWAAYDVPRHLWHFTPATMQQFGLKHRFILEQHYPMPFDAFYIAIISERYLGGRLYFFRGLYEGLRAWVNTLAKKGKSSSVIYIFRKKR